MEYTLKILLLIKVPFTTRFSQHFSKNNVWKKKNNPLKKSKTYIYDFLNKKNILKSSVLYKIAVFLQMQKMAEVIQLLGYKLQQNHLPYFLISIRTAGIIISCSLQMRVLLENTTFPYIKLLELRVLCLVQKALCSEGFKPFCTSFLFLKL